MHHMSTHTHSGSLCRAPGFYSILIYADIAIIAEIAGGLLIHACKGSIITLIPFLSTLFPLGPHESESSVVQRRELSAYRVAMVYALPGIASVIIGAVDLLVN